MTATWLPCRSGSKGAIRSRSRARSSAPPRISSSASSARSPSSRRRRRNRARPRFLRAFPRLTPLGGDLVIEKREASVSQPQKREAQEAGNLDRAVRVLDPRQRRRFPRHHPSGEMLETGERQIRQGQPVGSQFLEERRPFSICSSRPLAALARRHGTEPLEAADPAVLDRRQEGAAPSPLSRPTGPPRSALNKVLLVVPPRGSHVDAGCPARGAAGNRCSTSHDRERAMSSAWSKTAAASRRR